LIGERYSRDHSVVGAHMNFFLSPKWSRNKLEIVGSLAIICARGQLVVKDAGASGARASMPVWRSRRARCEVCP